MKKTAPIFLAFMLLSAATAQAKFDPAFKWSVIETDHFVVHFHQGGEESARRAAAVAEDVHFRLAPKLRWTPSAKTRLVIIDAMDEANGMASPIPYNIIYLLPTAPSGEAGFGLTSYDDWLRLVITHEYTHILQLDMAAGLPKLIRAVFGRIYFPNTFQPQWLIEGLATYEETEETSGGRGRSAWADMVLRQAVLENKFPSLDRMAVMPDTWPTGDVPYLFGQSFTRFLADKYGRDSLAQLSLNYSGRWFPFLVGSTARRIFKTGYRALYKEWRQKLQSEHEARKAAIETGGVTPSVAVTDKGFYNIHPAWSPDGSAIAFVRADGDKFPGIWLMDADGKNQRRLVRNYFSLGSSGSGVTWSPDGKRLYYSKLEVRRANLYSDIYYFDLERGRERRLTKNLRARDPHLSPDGKRMVCVINKMGKNSLALFRLPEDKSMVKAADVVRLTDEVSDQFADPRWSPDGTRIAVAVRRHGGIGDIWILDRTGGKFAEISPDRSIEGSPAWSADGSTVFFSSDRDGVFNIYAYHQESAALKRVTNVVGGAFMPAPAPNGKTMLYVSYSASGYDIFIMALMEEAWKPAGDAVLAYPPAPSRPKPVAAEIHDYSALSTVLPRFWLPWFGKGNDESGFMLGGFTYGMDALQKHTYYLTLLYGPDSGRLSYALDYWYDGLLPTFYLEARDVDVTYGAYFERGDDSKDYIERQRTLGLSVIAPIYRVLRQQYLTLGLRRVRMDGLSDYPPWPSWIGERPAEGVLVSANLNWRYNDAVQPRFAVSPEEGRNFELGLEHYSRILGSDYEFTRYTADWHEYIRLWGHHVLKARGFFGAATGDDPPQRAYQLGGDNPGDITISPSRDWVELRGYPPDSVRGRNAAAASLEYRFPIIAINRGAGAAPFYLKRIHGAAFFDAAAAWNDDFKADDILTGAGLEARLDMIFAYRFNLTLRIVMAKGFDENGEDQGYISVWIPY